MSWWMWTLLAVVTLFLIAGVVLARDGFGMNAFGLMCVLLLCFEFVGGGIFAIALASDRAGCRQIGRNYGTEVRYEFPGGCFMRVGDHFVPAGSYITNHEVK